MNLSRLLSAALLLLATTLASPAQDASNGEAADKYFQGYMAGKDAERLEGTGDLQQALSKYQQALDVFSSISRTYPSWQSEMLNYRLSKTKDAVARLEGQLRAPQPAPAPASAAQGQAPAGWPAVASPAASSASAPTAPGAAAPAGQGGLPSISEFLKSYEERVKQTVDQLSQENSQMKTDLGKWQEWYQWASREMQAAKETKDALANRAATLEQSILTMQTEVQNGRAAQAQLDALSKERDALALQIQQAGQRLATAEKTAKDASSKLAEMSAQVTTLQEERNKAVKEKDEAVKERDALSAQNLGMKTEIDQLKKRTISSEVTRLVAENERLTKELETARQQVETLRNDVTRKDQEITQLKGQITTIQGQLTALRQENATYQAQVSDLTMQLKQVQEKLDGKPGAKGESDSPELMAENQMLRSIILRQLRAQARQQQAKAAVIGELKKIENASQDLLQEVEQLATARVSLSPDEEKLFTDPQIRELFKDSGIQATLMASSSNGKPGPADKAATPPSSAAAGSAPDPDPASVNALLDKGNDALQKDQLEAAETAYADVLRADPKNVSALIGLGWAKIKAGKHADAEVSLKKCLAYDPNNDAAYFTLGVAHFKQERFTDAMADFEKSLAKRPQNARARHYLGIIATRLGLLTRAETEFKNALAIDPSYGEAHFNLAVLYVTWDPPKWDEARSHYADALKKGVKPDSNLEKILSGAAVSAR